ncbi:rare lipoprotein A [Colletotrichum scovillei]|uniref:Rare lipoprotein A n=6 Tax=Colletotrichum acutatum species complex TaxID=2707335 RepID=A0A9P7R6N5_9PEZI|nr:rare lipoprotein A [Colletotrichum scovillei]XP_060316738.1 rare lipoprotein A [Colletotrichum costaricense]XP_060388746.1 rare lipoprotein A [Colletotrichum tamarilloi]XP_060394320.1 rare lipoprotein A [Colletotrichum abscissum]KAI3531570.1 rare lipoprotein A [Colletotrichum filicis]KAK0381245.1 rare lipoprotein A [Colletotrichum limetticola]KAK1452314.1 rare lipoprotein A [Colletotrichum melonis]KAF4781549.1 rare lipoprotein A [Colletotrichum scovillei]KAG7050258.1 rare lipoprotein A [
MKQSILLLAASAAHMAFAKPVKSCSAKPRSTTVLTFYVTPTYGGPTMTPIPTAPVVQPTPVEPPVESSVESSAPVETPVQMPSVIATTASASATVVEQAAPSSSSSSASTPASSSTPIGSGGTKQGKSTFYGGNTSGGMCSFSTYTIPSGLYGTAFSGQAWDSAAHCGACVKVTGPNGNSITAMVVDQCPECDEGHLDLFQDAFTQLGTVSEGIISTSYEFVECGITSPIKLHNKTGTSANWFSMQVLNHNEPVAKLEVSTDGGSTWQATNRQPYNFFENSSGFGTETVDVRVTSESGKTITVNSVSVAADSEKEASSNF